jgi:hypothetical protein
VCEQRLYAAINCQFTVVRVYPNASDNAAKEICGTETEPVPTVISADNVMRIVFVVHVFVSYNMCTLADSSHRR